MYVYFMEYWAHVYLGYPAPLEYTPEKNVVNNLIVYAYFLHASSRVRGNEMARRAI